MKCSGLLISLLLCSFFACAQVDTIKLKSSETNKIVTDRPLQAVYGQYGGAGWAITVNYDRRFLKRLNGPGFSAGIGYLKVLGFGLFTLPVSVNYLFGRKTHFLELAGGTTYVSASVNWFDEPETSKGFIQHVNLGYRYQRAGGGFFFRGGYGLMFTENDAVSNAFLGFGYTF